MAIARVEGMDTSTWQDDDSTSQHIDFKKAWDRGIRFVWEKVSERLWVDADWMWNWRPAKDVGILRAPYHFLHWDIPGRIQAEFMWEIIKDDPGELPPIADFERRTGASSASRLILFEFCGRIEQLCRRKPIIYTSLGFWREFGTKDKNAVYGYPLALAQYTTAPVPIIPEPWYGYLFWQYTCKGDGRAYGAESASLDLDMYPGTLEDLRKFAGVAGPEITDEHEQLRRLWSIHPEVH